MTRATRKYLLVAFIVGLVRLCTLNADEPKRGPDPFRQKITSLQKILNEMPRESQPRVDKDVEIQLAKANDWLAKNLPGKEFEFKAKLYDVKVGDGKDGSFQVRLLFPNTIDADFRAGSIRTGGEDCRVIVNPNSDFWNPVVDEARVKQLQRLRGRDVTITGSIYMVMGDKSEKQYLPKFQIDRGANGKPVPILRLRIENARLKEGK